MCDSRDLDSNIEDFKAINGVILSNYLTDFDGEQSKLPYFRNMIGDVDAVFFSSPNFNNTALIKEALLMGKNVFCEGIATFLSDEYENLRNIAKQNNCLLIQGNKTYYSTAYNRMCLLVKSGAIGEILTLQSSISFDSDKSKLEASLTQALATSLLPVFQLIGLDFVDAKIQSLCINGKKVFNILLQYPNSSANISIYEGIATEEQLVITGANAFLYLPSQWWKTDYFEIRFKNELMNRRYFHKYNGNSIQSELLAFLKTINSNNYMNISEKINFAIVEFANKIIELYRK